MNKKFLGLFYGSLNEVEVEILDCLEENVEELIISEIEKDYCRKNFKLGTISVENNEKVKSPPTLPSPYVKFQLVGQLKSLPLGEGGFDFEEIEDG